MGARIEIQKFYGFVQMPFLDICTYMFHEIKCCPLRRAPLLVSGCCYSKPLLVPGGRAFVWPTIQCVQR